MVGMGFLNEDGDFDLASIESFRLIRFSAGTSVPVGDEGVNVAGVLDGGGGGS